MLQLLARKEQVKAPDPPRQTSLAAVLRIVRHMMQRDAVVPNRSERLTKQFAEAVTDDYNRTSNKLSRDYPRRKPPKRIQKPKIIRATRTDKRRLKKYLERAVAA